MKTLLWFRGKDLRVGDHQALRLALEDEAPEVLCLFVVDPFFFAPDVAQGCGHRMQYLVEALQELSASVERLGNRLRFVAGKSIDVVPEVASMFGADRVIAQRWTTPLGRKRDDIVAARLQVPLVLCEGETIAPPDRIANSSGQAFAVYSAFGRAFRREVTPQAPLAAPKRLPPAPEVKGLIECSAPSLEHLGIVRNPGLIEAGERAAQLRLRSFVNRALPEYAAARDQLAAQGTSRISADLKFGTLSPRTAWSVVERARTPALSAQVDKFHSELLWREFAHATAFAHPRVLQHPYRENWDKFPWRKPNAAQWRAWTQGLTGYPVVDASARQLLAEGFVHNRARMISASFLTKHLMVDYRRGEAHYLQHLVDGDWINNNAGWQWSAGCGQDAQPYFRVFNPVTQGQKFDANGDYVRRWVPELARLESRHIHAPWEASSAVLERAGVVLGKTYPEPIVVHREGRERFLSIAKDFLRS